MQKFIKDLRVISKDKHVGLLSCKLGRTYRTSMAQVKKMAMAK